MNARRQSTIRTTIFALIMVAAGETLIPAASQAATSLDSNVTVRVWPAATIRDAKVRLGQIATVTGDETTVASLKNLVVIEAVVGDKRFQIRASRIVELIGREGFDVTKITLLGAAGCMVTCVAPTETKTNDTTAPADSGTPATGPASLESHLRRVIAKALESKKLPREAKLKVAFSPTLSQVLSLTDPPYQFEISAPRTSAGLGLASMRVKIMRDGSVLQSLPVMAQVSVMCPMLVARKPINARARVTKSDVEMTMRELSSLNDKILIRVDDAVDQQAKKMIHPGTVLTRELLEPLPLVKRGQLVTVLYRRGGLDIRIVGKAMQNAFKGEIIAVRNERSKELFRARVTGDGQVSVEDLPAGGATVQAGESDNHE